MELIAERLFARFVAKQCAPGSGLCNPAKKSKLQQGRFRNAPLLPLGKRFVDPESGKRDEIHRDQRKDNVCRIKGLVEHIHGGQRSWQCLTKNR